ncbi:phosphate ABC transporter, inner membrane subunit PstA [Thermoclostridium stercorarium subsp. stercorarium DSM 8532]|jgi:phosphate transport system permease protein|uniref:Phosphate transport system permease protein PstA n=3 Tax=Thermoclostridium stercorarium TaxID=1510 RepID=L7VLX0_THES1|nr:phosphate ABC transporter permease PstA [Thermoclostridium stercorarium]AGC69180.1 phosphate ABC transporter, inner membrane subunit PstA [Thermoclostridium stercorarium subsp. stercorarium DSM 8532]AGI40151.1 ABC transporter periplasmic subunit [Thermoclostridium stercorarium subsp. stercorarium DSM 8532]ANW99458.1 phosphate ABC transporter, permease protein PstA [Thermoclostridium stercorarium subsp. thermolacticum DSM 2910]ANX02084.1 phosphate ABC transporter, permease protein PstA [Therm
MVGIHIKIKNKLRRYKRNPGALLIRLLVTGSAFITLSVLIFIIGYILYNGIPHITADFFAWEYNSVNVSVTPALVNTIIMVFFSLIITVPVGVFAAVYLVEYTKRENKTVGIIRLTTETLSAIPSIVYGLFGFLFFVTTLKWGISLISGVFTVSVMVLPLIVRTTEEALKAVPESYREGSFALGAGKFRTVFSIVIPAAFPGILSGIILAIGRIVGETAALIYTAGTVAEIPSGKDFLFDSARTLSLHMYALASEGLHINQAYATAAVLLVIVLLINRLSALLAKKIMKGKKT